MDGSRAQQLGGVRLDLREIFECVSVRGGQKFLSGLDALGWLISGFFFNLVLYVLLETVERLQLSVNGENTVVVGPTQVYHLSLFKFIIGPATPVLAPLRSALFSSKRALLHAHLSDGGRTSAQDTSSDALLFCPPPLLGCC